MTLDMAGVADFLRRQGLGNGDVRLRPISGGQSNPTFLLDSGGWQCVLRTTPPGPLLPSAHAIDREFKVMSALRDSGVPVPKVLAYCNDSSAAGREFYLMEFIEGRVYMDPSLPGLQPAQRGELYDEMNRVISAVHAVDCGAVGLESYGKRGGYLSRQISRWAASVQASRIPVGPEMTLLMDWLPGNIPADDETTLVHGDYRLDNLIFHPTEPRVLGVLDWELSTLGHPVADFAYHCMAWRIPATVWRGIGGLSLEKTGIPSEAAYIEDYATRTGRHVGRDWEFYMAFNLFRSSAILHGIAERVAQGNAAAADAAETARKAEPLAKIGWCCAERYMSRTHTHA